MSLRETREDEEEGSFAEWLPQAAAGPGPHQGACGAGTCSSPRALPRATCCLCRQRLRGAFLPRPTCGLAAVSEGLAEQPSWFCHLVSHKMQSN